MLVSRIKAVLRACELIHSVVFNSFATPRTVAHHVPLSMEFARQEYCSGLSFPPPWDLSNPGIEPESLVSPALAGGFFTTVPPGKPLHQSIFLYIGNIFKP